MPSPARVSALSFQDARAILLRELSSVSPRGGLENVALERAVGRVLAQPVAADRDYPTLDRSARDGFAVRSSDVPGRLRVIGEVRAGDRFGGTVQRGEAVEIMTGAPVPDGADTIVMVEHVQRDGASLQFDRGSPAGQFINYRGGEAAAGAVFASRRVASRIYGGSAFGGSRRQFCSSVSPATGSRVGYRRRTGQPREETRGTPDSKFERLFFSRSSGTRGRHSGDFGIARDDEEETRGLIDRG